METLQIDAKLRDTNVLAKNLRAQKIIPAVYYGKGKEPMSLQMEYQPFRKAFIKGGYSQLMDLNVDGKKYKVLVQEVQFEPMTGLIRHVDFKNINLKEEIITHVPVEGVGIAPAVKDFGGILTTVKHELKLKCLPMDLPHIIEADLTSIVDFAHPIHVKDISIPKGVTVLDDPDDVVFTVSAQKVEEEAPKVEEAVAVPVAGEVAAAPAAEVKEGKKA